MNGLACRPGSDGGSLMDLGLKGRVAIVAAASKGLGKAVALELAKEGAEVAICARGGEEWERTAREIVKAGGGKLKAQVVDVRDGGAIGGFVETVERRFGKLDICVTNSGGPPSKVFRDTTVEDWKSATDQLLMSTVAFARET